MRGKDAERKPLPITGDAEWSLPNAWRHIPGRSEGKSERMEARPLFGREYKPAAVCTGVSSFRAGNAVEVTVLQKTPGQCLHLEAAPFPRFGAASHMKATACRQYFYRQFSL
jgi:hypothetical protein